VRTKDIGEVPLYLRDAHYSGAEQLGRGIGYKYPHDYPQHYTPQRYLPESLQGVVYYQPTQEGYEQHINTFLKSLSQEK
jgi:putative ATPase